MCIPFYYFIPKSILSHCGAKLNAIPQNPQELFHNRKMKPMPAWTMALRACRAAE